jgi:hypothetical protein
MEQPTLLMWETDLLKSTWYGNVRVAASGGVGDYRYYRDAPDEKSVLADGVLFIQGRYCEDARATIWVLSGSEALRWEGRVPFPAPEACP